MNCVTDQCSIRIERLEAFWHRDSHVLSMQCPLYYVMQLYVFQMTSTDPFCLVSYQVLLHTTSKMLHYSEIYSDPSLAFSTSVDHLLEAE